MKQILSFSAFRISLLIIAFFLLPSVVFSKLMPGWFYYGMGNTLPNDNIMSIAVAPDGKVWIGCQKYQTTGGISVYDGKEWTHFIKGQDNLPSISINSINVDKNGIIYATFSDTIPFYYKDKLWQSVNMSSISSLVTILNPITFDANNRVWAGLKYFKSGYKGLGIAYYDKQWNIIDTSNSNIPDNLINCMHFDKYNKLWIASDSVIAKVKTLKNWEIYDASNGMNAKRITEICSDNNNIIWVSSMNGLHKYDGKKWITYDTTNTNITQNRLYGVKADKYNNLWIITEDSCVVKYDGKQFFKYIIDDDWKYRLNKILYSVEIDSLGNVWTRGSNNGCYMLNLSNTKVEGNEELSVNIYPNPTSDFIEIELTNLYYDYSITSIGDYQSPFITIYNALGIEVKKIGGNGIIGNKSIRISTKDFSAGMYFCTLIGNGRRETKRFVVVR